MATVQGPTAAINPIGVHSWFAADAAGVGEFRPPAGLPAQPKSSRFGFAPPSQLSRASAAASIHPHLPQRPGSGRYGARRGRPPTASAAAL